MALPAGRVLAIAKLEGLGSVQHPLNPAPDPACGLSLRIPDRLQDFHHMGVFNGANRQRADHWISVSFEGRAPLSGMFRTLPARLVGLNVSLRAFLEGHRLGLLNGERGLSGVPFLNGVYTVHNQAVSRVGLLTGVPLTSRAQRRRGPFSGLSQRS